MRKLLILGLLSLGLATLAIARQHAANIPVVAPPAIHAMPVASIGGAHVAPMRAPSQVRPGSLIPASGMRPAVAHKPAGRPVLPQPQPALPGGFSQSSFFPGMPYLNDNYPVPGLGFDYDHFFAVHPNWGLNHPVGGVVLPFIGGGFYIPVPYYTDSTPLEQAAPDDAAKDQPDANPPAYGQEPAPSSPSRSSSSSHSTAEPVPEFVFVKRDGTTFFAVAYTLLQDKLQYVTADGLRRSATLDSLDFDATRRFNEERGITINLPALPPSA